MQIQWKKATDRADWRDYKKEGFDWFNWEWFNWVFNSHKLAIQA